MNASGTFVEMIGYTGGGTANDDEENYIQGGISRSQTMGNSTAVGKSMGYDAGSDISGSIPSGDVVFAWVYFAAGANLYDYATTGGHRFGIGASATNFDMWFIGGDDRAPNPYGGWWNAAIDPTHTPDDTGGSGSGGAWRYFASLLQGLRAKIQKGTPHAMDVFRKGRGEIYCTGTGATFTLMAADNDASSARWGCLQDTGGGSFLWKGLMSMGQSGTDTTFSESNKAIVVDDTPKTYAGFNRVEFRNATSTVTWTNITFSAKGTFSKGDMEMMENGTWTKTGCSFNSLGSFTYLSGGVITSCGYNGCGIVTQGSATMTSCTFDGATGLTALVMAPTNAAFLKLVDCTFASSGTGYAVDLSGTTLVADTSINWD